MQKEEWGVGKCGSDVTSSCVGVSEKRTVKASSRMKKRWPVSVISSVPASKRPRGKT
jgi:hypothetical protein